MQRGSKRTLVKKITSLNLYVDQATQIQAIMEATGNRKEAPLVRELLDEALAVRRRKLTHVEVLGQPPPSQDTPETLHTIQTLLLRMIGQGQTGLRAHSISLALLQEILVETRAGRMSLWDCLAMPALKERGHDSQQLTNSFDAQTDAAKDFAYDLAETIRDEHDQPEPDSKRPNVDDDDRQQPLVYESPDNA